MQVKQSEYYVNDSLDDLNEPDKLYQLNSSAKILSCPSMAPHGMPLMKWMNADTYRLTNGIRNNLPESYEFTKSSLFVIPIE